MDQNKIGNLIKELRLKSNLTQSGFAQKYNVSFQAVSKWENGKNIPDISLLKQICDDYNISVEKVLNGQMHKKRNIKLLILLFVLILIIILLFIIRKPDFEFKTFSSNCPNFTISGSIAYSKNKSYLHLSNVNYCGGDDDNVYDKIECSLYEQKDNVKKELSKCDYDIENVDLETFLKNVEFKLDNFSSNCSSYNNNSLYLEINASLNNKTTNYKIPISLSNTCN